MHIADAAKRRWTAERFEGEQPAPDPRRILDLLVRADVFEQVIQARYPGTKRFSLEGVTALIPFLDALLHRGVDRGMRQAVANPSRLLLCTGKIGHELRAERTCRQNTNTGILFLEQLYPWPAEELAAALERYANAHEIVWVQEEPANMGPLSFVVPRLRRMARGRQVHTVKRSAAASPATGSAKAHALEQKTLLAASFGGRFPQ